MYHLKAFVSKLFSQLRIPSEREIRDLQLRQVQREHQQASNSGKFTTDAQLDCAKSNLDHQSNQAMLNRKSVYQSLEAKDVMPSIPEI